MKSINIDDIVVQYPEDADIDVNIHLHIDSDKESSLSSRESSDEGSGEVEEVTGQQYLRKLDDGTQIRHEFKRGDHAGEVAVARIVNGIVVYDGEEMNSPSAAVRRAVEDIKGEPVHGNGWTWWRFYDDEDGEWKPLDDLRG